MDADRIAWVFANLSVDIDTTYANIIAHLERLRVNAGCDSLNLHVTTQYKGGREVIATVKPYQGNRAKIRENIEKRELIQKLRYYIGNLDDELFHGVIWNMQEADDGICQFQRLTDSSVLISDDKDLRQCPGWHYNRKTHIWFEVTGIGYGEQRGNKYWACGTLFFWHQMLMGDAVDNIPGLERIGVATANKYFPIQRPKGRKPKLCGEKTSVVLISGCKTDQELYDKVSSCYKDYYGSTWETRLFEQAFLLWMRLNDDVLDVITYLRPLGFKYTLTDKQKFDLQPWLNMDN